MNRNIPPLIALGAGAASALGFAPLNLWPLTIAAFALWFGLVAESRSRRGAFFVGWAFGVGHFAAGLNWIAHAFTFQDAMPHWLGWVAVVLLSLYLAVFPGLAALGARMMFLAEGRAPEVSASTGPRPMAGNGLLFVLTFAALWIITEWLRSWVFSGFIWNPLGVIAVGAGAAGSAKLLGSYGLSGLVMLVAGAVWLTLRAALAQQWSRVFRSAVLLFAIAVFSGGAGILGGWNSYPIKRPQPIPVTVVQPNIGQEDKWQLGFEERNFSKLANVTQRIDPRPHLIFWPEAAIPDFLEFGYPRRYYYDRPPQMVRAQLASIMHPGDILMLGALKFEFGPDNKRAIGARNSIFAMDAQQRLLGRYDKSHLVPYGEYLPMRPILSAIGLSRLAPGDLDFWPGPGPATLTLPRFGKVGLQVCYEIIFSGHVVDRKNRPDFLFNPSNDAWFGSWGPPQHLAQARLRAIEEAMPVIRSTPTGVSAVIDAEGRLLATVPMGKAGRIESSLPTPRGPTIFAQFGNMLSLLFAALLLVWPIAIRFTRR